MSKEKKKTDPIVVLLDLVIIAMIYVVLVKGFLLFSDISHEKKLGSFTQDSITMDFDLKKNNYAYLIQGMYMNKNNRYNKPAQYHALAEYTEAAFLYKVYDEKGYEAEAAGKKAIMDSTRKSMGSLTIFADRVDGMLRDFGEK